MRRIISMIMVCTAGWWLYDMTHNPDIVYPCILLMLGLALGLYRD